VSPQYAAVSYVVVSPAGHRSDPSAALGYAQAYGRIATDPMVVALAERRAGLRSGSIADDVRASTSPDAPMVEITATSPSPERAARTADAVAEALSDTASFSARRTGARLTVVSEAVAPSTPVSPSSGITTAVGACAGGLLGGLIVLVRRRPTADVPDSPAEQTS
jgi:capsular polysaccharide biosynthesis protein